MIKTLLFTLFTVSNLFATYILSYNIYNRTDRVDVMLTFDTPYHGKIVKTKNSTAIILKLYGAKIEAAKQKRLQSRFVQSLLITPLAGYTQIVANLTDPKTKLKVSKTADSYGLRLRFYKPTASQTNQIKTAQSNQFLSTLPTKKRSDITASYYIVMIILVVGVIVLLLLKRKVAKNPKEQYNKGWLFGAKQSSIKSSNNPTQNSEVIMRFQKRIDEKNSVVLLEFMENSYLLLIGEHNNILLDRFSQNRPATQEEFEKLLHEKDSELERFLHEATPLSHKEPEEDTLKNFSKKASHIPFD